MVGNGRIDTLQSRPSRRARHLARLPVLCRFRLSDSVPAGLAGEGAWLFGIADRVGARHRRVFADHRRTVDCGLGRWPSRPAGADVPVCRHHDAGLRRAVVCRRIHRGVHHRVADGCCFLGLCSGGRIGAAAADQIWLAALRSGPRVGLGGVRSGFERGRHAHRPLRRMGHLGLAVRYFSGADRCLGVDEGRTGGR